MQRKQANYELIFGYAMQIMQIGNYYIYKYSKFLFEQIMILIKGSTYDIILTDYGASTYKWRKTSR